MNANAWNVIEFPRRREAEPTDTRFRALLGEAGWASLPEATRRRFSRHLSHGRTVTYTGEVVEVRISRVGWLLAQAARLIGAPLPLNRDEMVPTAVAVTEDEPTGGQFWTRIYGRHRGFPQVIQSAKRFAGPTGLEEHLGHGVTMMLRVAAEEGVLKFHSVGYAFVAFGVRFTLPGWLGLPDCTVSHVDCGHGAFAFVLDVSHVWLGELIHQTGLFIEQTPEE
ncbi:MAG: DUF4166 domain-containing protein [Sphingomonadales bacterium]